MRKKNLRSGYTTGACAAAAAKAAVLLLFGAGARKRESGKARAGARHAAPLRNEMGTQKGQSVEIPFPDGGRVKFRVLGSGFGDQGKAAWASVVKDAGDDPDVTHGAEIVAEARIVRKRESVKAGKKKEAVAFDLTNLRACELIIKGGEGVGTVTKPGLSVPVGGAAINPVPKKMIEEAVREVLSAEARKHADSCRGTARLVPAVEITISVPNGKELAKKTLNHRLGIIGGISILGTTGIVKPVSCEAWIATITSSMDVAKATGLTEIVLSAGRSSERSHMQSYNLPEESYVLMGDHLEYALLESARHGFQKVHLCAQWAKMLKIGMATPQTHVRFGAIDTAKAVGFLNELGIAVPRNSSFNTAREIYDWINEQHGVGANGRAPLQVVCNSAKSYAEKVTGRVPVSCYLVSYQGEIVAVSE